jgi:hypothetical protein
VRKSAGAVDRLEGLANLSGNGGGCGDGVRGPGEEETFKIRSLWLVSALNACVHLICADERIAAG